jgi:hypothetical protein
MPRVEAVPHRLDAQDVDVGRQEVVDAASKRFRRSRPTDVEVGDLRQRMDPGVGAAGPLELEAALAGRVAGGALELPQDGAGILLDLPAAVARAGVLDGQFEPHARPASYLQRTISYR